MEARWDRFSSPVGDLWGWAQVPEILSRYMGMYVRSIKHLINRSMPIHGYVPKIQLPGLTGILRNLQQPSLNIIQDLADVHLPLGMMYKLCIHTLWLN